MALNRQLVTTGNELHGYRVVRELGIMRGISVRSRSVVGNMMGAFQSFFGGSISVYQQLCEQARHEAFEIMLQHAERVGAHGIIAFRYDANEIMQGITEVLAYGTAVELEKTGH
jgi:uncharacterized protein YbjQ (UPF0145 family)